MSLEHVAREQLRIARTNRINEVLVVRIFRRRQPGWLAVRVRRVSAGPFLVLRSEVGLPLAPALLDPEPAFRAVEEIADPHAAFIVGEPAARAELENLAVGVLEEARLFVWRFL